MSLQIPNYIIDERFITALRRNLISYLSSYFYNDPRHLFQYYYHISSKSDTGIFETLFFVPAKYVLTPLGFAVLYNNVKSLEYLLELGADPNAFGVVIDCPVEDAKLRWKVDLFRLHEVYPICLTTPETIVFNRLVEYGLKMSSEYKLRFRLVTSEEMKERTEICRGMWELVWIFWIKMRNPKVLLKVTDLLLVNGMNATRMMERVNLVPMLKKIFKSTIVDMPNQEEASFIIDLVKILLWNGCNFDESRLVENVYPCVAIFFKDPELIHSSEQEIISRYQVLQGIFNISKTFRQCLCDQGRRDVALPCMDNSKYLSLEVICVTIIRRLLTGMFFSKKLSALNMDVIFKEIIQTGIPGLQRKRALFQESQNVSKSKVSIIFDNSIKVIDTTDTGII